MRCATQSRPAVPPNLSPAASPGRVKVFLIYCCALAGSLTALAGDIDVVINEIMYHPPAGQTNLQYVELFNRGSAEINLSKWAFTKGVQFAIPDGTRLAPGGYLVICRDTAAFAAHYGQQIPVAGNFIGKLSHKSERLELVNGQGQRIDSVKYSDHDGWPEAANGYSSSLERISPFAQSDLAGNWAASNWPAKKKAAGTPGRKNDTFSTNLPPLVDSVEMMPKAPAPEQEVKVRVKVADANGIKAVSLLFRLARPGSESEERTVTMTRVEGDDKSGIYEGMIEGQPHGQLVRYRIRATGSSGTERLLPSPNDPRPAFSFVPLTKTPNATIPLGYAINVGRIEQGPPHNTITSKRSPPSMRGKGAFVYAPNDGGDPEVFDYVQIITRSGGHKIHFQKDHPLKGTTGINLIVEGPLRWILSEPLSYELYRMAGVPSPMAEHVRLSMDGRNLGVHLLTEQPNKSFLARNARDDTGNLYKLAWYGQNPTEQHQKRTNLRSGHADLLQLLDGLKNRSSAEQWAFIEKNFNVEEFASYYAVNMCIQNWDGFFNNYYAYHDSGKTGKWEIYPWDEDKTWGDYDGASSNYDWYEMPLTYGMAGNQSPRDFARWGSGIFGGVSWWRPPGHFSGPLLANPEFRKRFLARLQEICTTNFTIKTFYPIIDAMEKRLEPEVRLRATILQQDPRQMLQDFADDMDSFREQVQNRRKFILKQLARSE
ncbi:MAG: CotH kinase family protein [Verrucomicrobiota bacterium]